MNLGESGQVAPMRKLIEMALAAGRKRQNGQTGFVHHLYHARGDEPHFTIPLYENVLFSLALFRSRLMENMEEAKQLLDRLLYFQSSEAATSGNFPLYIHEFPHCRDRYLGASLLLPLYNILASFQHILGGSLKLRVEESVRALLSYYDNLAKEVSTPSIHLFKIATASQAFGTFWNEPHLVKWAEDHFKQLKEQPEHLFSRAPALVSEILPSLQIVHSSEIIRQLKKNWHPHLLTYVGPPSHEWQEGFEPQVTLYDLYMSLLWGSFSKRALEDHIVHLAAAQLQPLQQEEEELLEVFYPRILAGVSQEKNFALAISSDAAPLAINPPNFHYLRLAWGGPQKLHTLVCQGGNIANHSTLLEGKTIQLEATLGATPPEGDREKSREISLYLNADPVHQILVDNSSATTFCLGDTIAIKSGLHLISLTFTLQEGSGDFLGHIMPGNRPSQLSNKGDNRFLAYDWQIFLRTLRRSETCRFTIKLEIGEAHVD